MSDVPTSGVPEVGQPLGLLLLPVLLQPLPPLPQLVLQQLLLVVPNKYFWVNPNIFPVSLLKVADDDGQREGHGEGSAYGSEGAHKLAQPGDREDVSISG